MSTEYKTEYKTLSFSIQGEFITQLAREQCYNHGRFNYAIDLLMSCMETPQLTKKQIFNLAFDVLNGEAEIRGTYPGDDYGLFTLEDGEKKNSNYDIGNFIEKLVNKKKEQEEEINKWIQKFEFLKNYIPDHQLRYINDAYEREYDEKLFTIVDNDLLDERTVLGSYLKRMTDQEEHSTEDYGWLAPNGTFYPVEWGEHQKWAAEYLDKKYPFEKYPDLYWHVDNNGKRHHIVGGDVLVYRLNWVLLHNPSQGIAFPTKNPGSIYTKSQKKFLYDYYIERNCHKEANAFYED